MTDTELWLSERLARLEAAIPAPPTPLPRAVGRRTRRPRSRTIALLAAAVLLLGVAGSLATVGANLPQYPDVPDPNVTQALQEAGFANADGMPQTVCFAPEDAAQRLKSALAAHQIKGWTVEVRPGVGNLPCEFADQIPPIHVVGLFPSMGEAAASILHQVQGQLLGACYHHDEAFALMTDASHRMGVKQFEISANPWDPHGSPIGQGDAYQAHVDAGCFVYAGSGGKADGTEVYYLWGPWP